jgi:hypothetical protein
VTLTFTARTVVFLSNADRMGAGSDDVLDDVTMDHGVYLVIMRRIFFVTGFFE